MKQLFDQIRGIWTSGTSAQRALGALGLVLVLAAAGFSAWIATRPDWALLFGNLEPADAALVVDKVRSLGAEAEVRDGGRSVYVPRGRVAELRMQVSAAGLPQGGGRGWELFDSNGFGVSEFVQNVNLRRALEGELARSIRSFDAVESAQVRISPGKRSPFVDRDKPAKASVIVKPRSGRRLGEENVRAIQHLVAGAVEDLDVDGVRVLDTAGRLLSVEEGDDVARRADSQLELRRKEEEYRRKKALAILEALPVRGDVRVSLELDFQHMKETSETYDPQGTVLEETLETRQTQEASATAVDGGTKEKLQGPQTAVRSPMSSETEETTKTVYGVGKKVREQEIDAPTVRRMSVSLVVPKEIEAELPKLQELVKAAVGFVDGRDVMQTMAFEFAPEEDVPAPPEGPDPLLVREIAERSVQVVGILGALLLLLKVLKSTERRGPRSGRDSEKPAQAPAAVAAEPPPQPEPLADVVRGAVERDPERAARVLQKWLRAEEKV